MSEDTPTARWITQPDGTVTPVRKGDERSTLSGVLTIHDVLPGDNIEVTNNGDGTLTIGSVVPPLEADDIGVITTGFDGSLGPSDSTVQVALDTLDDSVRAAMPCGGLVMWPTTTAPLGWLLCDGTSHLRDDYPALFAVIGTTFGSVDGTHFNVPDMRGRFPVGFKSTDTDFDAMGEVGGSKTHAHSTPAHTHPLSDNGAAKIEADDANDWVRVDNVPTASSWTADARTNSTTVVASGTTGAVGAGLIGDTDASTPGVTGSSSGLPPYMAINFIIKAA